MKSKATRGLIKWGRKLCLFPRLLILESGMLIWNSEDGWHVGTIGTSKQTKKNPHIYSFIYNSAADATEDLIKISVYYKHTDVHIAATVALTCRFQGSLDARQRSFSTFLQANLCDQPSLSIWASQYCRVAVAVMLILVFGSQLQWPWLPYYSIVKASYHHPVWNFRMAYYWQQYKQLI